MKKLLAVILSFAILTSFAALPVNATDYTTSEKEEILALACQVFPEYSNVILGNVSANRNARSGSNKAEVVFAETRRISENESLSMTQFSDGGALLALTNVNCTKTYDDVEYANDLLYWTVSGEFTLTYTEFPGVCNVNNVQCTINPSGSDVVTNTGRVSYNSYCEYSRNSSTSTAALHTVLFYQTSTQSNLPFKSVVLGFEIVNDSVEAYGRDAS